MYSKYPTKIYGFISAAVLAIIIIISTSKSSPSVAYTPKTANKILHSEILNNKISNSETALEIAPNTKSQLLAQAGQFTLPPLPYEYAALEAYIDRATMTIHHDKHHAGYVKNLNEAIALYPQLEGQSVEELLVNLESLPADVRTTIRNNGGGHANHTMFWSIMSPDSQGTPTGEIATEIDSTFGDFATFQTEFNTAGKTQFGSGWAWLVMNPDGSLEVTSTANQDSPLLEGKYPIMGNDVWEHAYYLKYQNKRGDYLDAWWNVVNWDEVNNRLQAANSFFEN